MHLSFARRVLTPGIFLLVCLATGLTGCRALAKKGGTGVVVARRAQVRSSTAVVAADLLEVNRGDEVEILDSLDVPDPSDNTRKERWLRVRARDEEKTEGWIEARNIMPQDVLDASRRLAEEDAGRPGQATGQLRAGSNLRLSPDRAGNENIMMRLESGSSFEILGWKRVPKPKASETIESDVAPKPGSAPLSSPVEKGSSDDNEEEGETNELWYKVRLSPSFSPAPEGWIYGKQVELTVPSDIIYYRTGRDFVAWRRLEDEASDESSAPKYKDVAKEGKPGSWVILEKSKSEEGHKLDEPDFDRIYVLGYDKRSQEHYTAYRSPDLQGYLPLRVEGRGANRTFTVEVKDDSGQMNELLYRLYRDDRGIMRVTPPREAGQGRRRR